MLKSILRKNQVPWPAALLGALIDQVVGTLGDKGYDMAQTAGIQLLSPVKTNGILYGPRSPHYQKEPRQQ